MSELEQAIKDAKTDLEQKVDDLKLQFEQYQEEYYKLEAISEGFRVTAERLNSENDLFRQLFFRLQELVHKNDFESVKKLISGMSIKL